MQRIDNVLEADKQIAQLRDTATKLAKLQEAVVSQLPAWIDASKIEVVLTGQGVLRLSVPPAHANLLSQILPLFPEKLAKFGVRTVELTKRISG